MFLFFPFSIQQSNFLYCNNTDSIFSFLQWAFFNIFFFSEAFCFQWRRYKCGLLVPSMKKSEKVYEPQKNVWKSQWFTGVATRVAVSIASTAMHHVSDSSWLPLEPFLDSNGNMLQQWMGPVASWRDPAFTNLQPCYSQNTKLSTGCLFWKYSLLAKWAKCPSFWNNCS